MSAVCGDSRSHKGTTRISLKASCVCVGQVRPTSRALVGRADADLVQVPCAAGLRVLGEPDLLPQPGLKVVALRATHIPVTLVRAFVQLMELLPSRPALRHEHPLAHPAERRHARARFRQVSGRCHPTLVGDDVTQGQALKVGLVPDAATVECHAVEVRRRRAVEVFERKPCLDGRAVVPDRAKVTQGEVLGLGVGGLQEHRRPRSVHDDVAGEQAGEQRLARLDAGEDSEQTRLGIGGDAQRFRDPRRAVGPERPGHRRVGDGVDVVLEPLHHVARVGRTQDFPTDAEQVSLVHLGRVRPSPDAPKPRAP